jgi:chromosome segregation ATPase
MRRFHITRNLVAGVRFNTGRLFRRNMSEGSEIPLNEKYTELLKEMSTMAGKVSHAENELRQATFLLFKFHKGISHTTTDKQLLNDLMARHKLLSAQDNHYKKQFYQNELNLLERRLDSLRAKQIEQNKQINGLTDEKNQLQDKILEYDALIGDKID